MLALAKQNVPNYIDINGPSLLDIYTFIISQLVVISDTITAGASQAIIICQNINQTQFQPCLAGQQTS
jgi:hypothetical protein